MKAFDYFSHLFILVLMIIYDPRHLLSIPIINLNAFHYFSIIYY